MLAQASIRVPSTEKCSLESRLRTCDRFQHGDKELLRARVDRQHVDEIENQDDDEEGDQQADEERHAA
ncbi:MAG: hypothetical protein M5U07_00865 [Xanthobacteraceae bacterium]|nr:hypothetical protein [Xanthobacteraceae bacterium]